MPTYTVDLEDSSTYPEYADNEVIIRTEVFPIYDNRIHSPEQSAGQLEYTTFRIHTQYRYEQSGFIGPMEYKYTKSAYDSYRNPSNSRRVASAPSVISPKRGKKRTSGARSIKNASSYGPRPRCPKGYYYDSTRKMCVRIKGRNKNASKKKFWNGKYR